MNSVDAFVDLVTPRVPAELNPHVTACLEQWRHSIASWRQELGMVDDDDGGDLDMV